MLVNPVLAALKDNIFFLKYNLNPPTNASFKSELGTVNPTGTDCSTLYKNAIDETKRYIEDRRQ